MKKYFLTNAEFDVLNHISSKARMDWFYLFSDPKVDKDAYWLEQLASGNVIITTGNKLTVQ